RRGTSPFAAFAATSSQSSQFWTPRRYRARVPPAEPTPLRAATSAVITTVATVCPVFLVGGLSVQIGKELHFSPSRLGLAVASYFTASALASFWAGRLVEHKGSRFTARLAIVLAV